MAHAVRDRSTAAAAPPLPGRGRPPVVDGVRATFRQRLRWRLTASYALVTVAVLAVVQVALLLAGAIWMIVVLGHNGDQISRDLRGHAVPVLAPLLAPASPDLPGIDRWLREIEANGLVPEGDRDVEIRPDVSILARSQTRLLVVDRAGNLAGAIKQTTVPTTAAPAAFADLPGLPAAVTSALAGDETSTPVLRWRGLPNRMIVAVPVRDGRGSVVGAVVFAARSPLEAPVDALGRILGVSAVAIILFGAVIGTISGYLAARTLVVRFDRMADAATAWGVGNFSATVADGGEDEIGQLGRRLNRMAERLADLIRAREQLSIVDERNRLARDLHDSVKQQAFAVSMHLATAREVWDRAPADARRHLDAAYDIARRSQGELTTIIQTLRPTELADSTVDRALERHVAEWAARTGIAASTTVALDPASPGATPVGATPVGATIPHAVEDALFRVTQEALTNVTRHSRATRVVVTLGRDRGGWLLEVVDDGTGFDPRRARRGVGLQSMRERVEAVGGAFAVASGPEGSRVSARIPPAVPREPGEPGALTEPTEG